MKTIAIISGSALAISAAKYLRVAVHTVLLLLLLCVGVNPAIAGVPGTIKWKYPLTTLNPTAAVALGVDGTIYVPSANSLLALNSNGTLKWTFVGSPDDLIGTPSIGHKNIVYVIRFANGGYRPFDNGVYAIDNNGKLLWTFAPSGFDIPGSERSVVAIGLDDTVYVQGYSPPNLYLAAIGSSDEQKWLSSYKSIPAIDTYGNLYSIDNSGYASSLFRLSPIDGSAFYIGLIDYDDFPTLPSIGLNGDIYIIDEHIFKALSPDGKKTWQYVHQGTFASQPGEATTAVDGTIYFWSYDYSQWLGRLHALNPDGSVKWVYDFPPGGVYPMGSPAIGNDGTIYVAASSSVMAFNPDGVMLWDLKNVAYNSPVLGADGTLYILGSDTLSGNTYLYAINTSSTGPANSSWPMMGADAQHTRVARGIIGPIILDPVCKDSNNCNGEYLKEKNGDVSLVDDLNKLLEAKVNREGVVTDGVTLLLLRVQSDNPVTFTLKTPNGEVPSDTHPCQWGELMQRNDPSTSSCSSITVEPESVTDSNGNNIKVAFAAYRAPLNFPLDPPAGTDTPQKTTSLTIEAKSSSSGESSNAELTLHRPPVVMVHGLWSDSGAWEGLKEYLRGNQFNICSSCRPNYGKFDPAGDFDPVGENKVVLAVVSTAIRMALAEQRKNDIAASQVDIVGHSMGGLIARALVARESVPYKTKVNYNKGYFHKIITVGTPHKGTPMADWLVNNKSRTRIECTEYICYPITLEDELESFSMPLGPAINSLQTTSTAIEHIGSTEVPSYAIVGIEPPVSLIEAALDGIFLLYGASYDSVDIILGREGQHDIIVPRVSQQGGLDKYTNVFNIVHCCDDPVITETGSPVIWEEIARLLREPVNFNSGEFGYFPALEIQKTPIASTGYLLHSNQTLQTTTTKVSSKTSTSQASMTLMPSPGTIVHPGENVQITFTLSSGNPVTGAIFGVGGALKFIEGTGPFSISYPVPSTRAGRIDIHVITTGPGPENYAADTYIIAQPSEQPESITASPDSLEFVQLGEVFPITVTGIFTGDTKIDLTSSSAGTTYATLSGSNNVISVTPEGVVEARGSGQDKVVITNSDKSTTVEVTVKITNQAPVLDPLSDVTMKAGSQLDIPVKATDPDGNALHLSLVSPPSFATLVDSGNGSGLLQLRPDRTISGTFSLGVAVVDEGVPPFGDSKAIQVTVEAVPNCAENVSSQVTVTRSGFLRNRVTGRYQQTLTLQNNSANPVTGSVSLVLDNLSSNATLFTTKTGNTACTAPAGSSYLNVDIGSDNVLGPGEVATVKLEFTNPANQPINYDTRVLSGAGER